MEIEEAIWTSESILKKVDTIFGWETVTALGNVLEKIDNALDLEKIQINWEPKIGDRIRPKNAIVNNINYGYNERIITIIKGKNFVTVCEDFEGTETSWNRDNVTWHPRVEDLLKLFAKEE